MRTRILPRIGTQPSLNRGPNVYGSDKASRFVSDLASGTDSLDIILLGDSNTGSAIAGMWGYHQGFCEAMNGKGWTFYGTPVLAAMNSRNVDNAPDLWRGGINYFAPTGSLLSGNTSGGATAYSIWSPTGNWTRYGSSGVTVTALTGVSITSTSGDFLCTATAIPLRVGQTVTISGTFGGTGSISGYTNPKTYYIVATNGSTTFQLSASINGTPITTTAGTPTGLTYTPAVDSRDDWAYISSTTQYYQTYGIYINSNNPLAVAANTLYYRIRYGTFTTSGGGFCPMVFNGSSAEQFSPRKFQSSTGSSYSYAVREDSWVTAGTTSYRGTWSFVGTGSDVCKGPMAIANQSFYRRTKGWSIHSHAYLGGQSSDMIASTIKNNVPLTVMQMNLQEIRERQITAGGTGRVLLMYQAGINSSPASGQETASKWVAAARDIWDVYKAAWVSLGYPLEDLACCFWCSHQANSADTSNPTTVPGNMIAVRAAANQMAIDVPDMTVIDIKRLLNYNQLLMGTGDIGAAGNPVADNGKPYYQRISNWPTSGSDFYEHLSGGWTNTVGPVYHPTDGYTIMCNNILNALLSA